MAPAPTTAIFTEMSEQLRSSAQRLQHQDRQQCGNEIQQRARDENAAPAGRRRTDQAAQGYKERCDALCDVEQSGIRGGELPPIGVAADSRKEAVDLAVREEREAG